MKAAGACGGMEAGLVAPSVVERGGGRVQISGFQLSDPAVAWPAGTANIAISGGGILGLHVDVAQTGKISLYW